MDASSLHRHSIAKYEYTAILIGQYGSNAYPEKNIQEESLAELFLLADTAYVETKDELFFKISHPDPGQFFPETSLQEIKNKILETRVNLVICDVNLKPGQLRTLEESLNIRVIGRIELILDIFAMRAKTKSAALQVELAQLNYILPRLKGLGNVLSRLGGGIGTRGPGESMLETDRRHIRRRIAKIHTELESQKKHRENIRKNRSDITFALVGYTNTGKTSLLNMIGSSANLLFAEDRLFATLDSHSRKVYLGEYEYVPLYAVISDTIGFIRNLPASLVAAFSSTLEEISHTDALIIVLDSSSPTIDEEYSIVNKEIERLKLDDKPRFIFLNKDDLAKKETKDKLKIQFSEGIWGNTLSRNGVNRLRETLFKFAKKKKMFR